MSDTAVMHRTSFARLASPALSFTLALAACDDGASTTASGGAGSSTNGASMSTNGASMSTSTMTTGSNTTTSSSSGGMTMFDPASCSAPEIRCVDDTPGVSAEYPNIQAGVDASGPGDSVWVFAGAYPGFRVETSGTQGSPITVRAETGVTLTGPEAQTHNFIRIHNASYVVIEGFVVKGPGQPQPYDYDYACIAARGATSDAPMHGLVFRFNDVSGCSPSGMYLSQAEGLLLEGNYIHDNLLEQENGNGNGVYLANAGTDNVVVRANAFVGNAGNGIHFNGDASIGGDGVQTGHLFEGNLIASNGVNGFNMDGVQSSTFVNNVFAKNGRHGVRGFAIDAAAGPKDDVFVNDTFYGNVGSGVKMSEDGGGHVLFNDLFVDNAEGGFAIDETTPQVSNNLETGSPAGLFVDAPGGNYRLAPGADAIDAGIASFSGHAAPTTDYAGFARSGNPDQGAYESGSP